MLSFPLSPIHKAMPQASNESAIDINKRATISIYSASTFFINIIPYSVALMYFNYMFELIGIILNPHPHGD